MGRAIESTRAVGDQRSRDPLGLVRAYLWVASIAPSVVLAAYVLNWATAGEVTWARWSLVLLGAVLVHTVLMLPFYYRVFDREWRARATASALARAAAEPDEKKRLEREKATRGGPGLVKLLPLFVTLTVGLVLCSEAYDMVTQRPPWAAFSAGILFHPPTILLSVRDPYRPAFAEPSDIPTS